MVNPFPDDPLTISSHTATPWLNDSSQNKGEFLVSVSGRSSDRLSRMMEIRKFEKISAHSNPP